MGTTFSRSQSEQTVSEGDEGRKGINYFEYCRDLNQLVMNYLVVEGYRDAAEQFSLESGLEPTVDLQSIQERMDIRHAVQSGDIDTAIDLVNELNPEVGILDA